MDAYQKGYMHDLIAVGRAQEKALNFPKLNKRYELLGMLGQGKWGTVAKAQDKVTGQIVAVKKIKMEGVEEVVLALREAILLTEQSHFPKCHPNIVCIHQHEIQDDIMYIVTEFIEGATLASLAKESKAMMNRNTPKEYTDFFWLCIQIFDALATLHQNGIVHRDLHSDNIMLTKDRYAVKIIDFGLACDTSDDPVIRCPIKGIRQLYFTPPEILYYISEGENINVNLYKGGDIWAVGLTLHYAIFNRYPFTLPMMTDPRDTLTTLMKSIKNHFEIEEHSTFEDVTYLLEKLLERNPYQRWTAEKAKKYCTKKWKKALHIKVNVSEENIQPMTSLWQDVSSEELAEFNLGYAAGYGDV